MPQTAPIDSNTLLFTMFFLHAAAQKADTYSVF